MGIGGAQTSPKGIEKKWVYRVKLLASGGLDKYKSRLVAKGFQQKARVDLFETFSVVVRYTTVRVVLTLAFTKYCVIRELDVNNAFPNGDLENVYMSQPQGFEVRSSFGLQAKEDPIWTQTNTKGLIS